MTALTITSTSHAAALADVEPAEVRRAGYGERVTLDAPDAATREAWINRMIVAACDAADRDDYRTAERLYADVERADRDAMRPAHA